MLRVFGIPNCDTVKKAKRFLDESGVNYEFCNFKKEPPTMQQLLDWEKQVGEDLVNKKGRTFRLIKEDFETLGQKERLKLLQTNTSAIKRPLIERDGKVLTLGFDEKKLMESLDS